MIATLVVAGTEVQLLTVTVTEYTPALAGWALLIVGFCAEDVNDGPVQLYVAPAIEDAVRFRVVPAHSGPLFDATGGAGLEGSVSVIGPAVLLLQPASVS
jgi:hypothetical protein